LAGVREADSLSSLVSMMSPSLDQRPKRFVRQVVARFGLIDEWH
jgi:hypothetical protein